MGTAGVNIPSQIAQIFASVSEAIIYGTDPSVGDISFGPWTPPQYSQPAITMITVPATTSPTLGVATSDSISYVFDAVFRLLHRRTLHKTSHPVLTGANISDHAYIEPARVTLEIGMSDCMASFSNGIWVGASTKSASAWQIIKGWQTTKQLLTLQTRLDIYTNMLVIEANAPDDVRTRRSLKATIVFEELLSASVYSSPAQSALPQTTGSTKVGTVQPMAPNASQAQGFQVPNSEYPTTPTYPQVPGAGSVSGVNGGTTSFVLTGTSEGNPGVVP